LRDLRGASKLADAVRITLGPKSKSALIQKQWGTPIVCNDGVTVAKEFAGEPLIRTKRALRRNRNRKTSPP
jgi:chaperonin GroEL (HSP60 family)